MSHNTVTLLLGSNLGDLKKNLNTALHALESRGCIIEKKTKYLYNKAIDFHSCNNFCNIAAEIRTDLSPMQLLSLIKVVEREMGRVEDSADLGKYMDRCIDIDIVLYNGISFQSPRLVIPHQKNLRERDFSRRLLLELRIK